jgi:hypothetical protein
VFAPEHVVIIYLGLAAVAVGFLGLRALFLGVCEHLEADDVPQAVRDRLAAGAMRKPAVLAARRAHSPARITRRPAYLGLHLSAHR